MSTPLKLDHMAFRCRDAKETVDFYEKYLDMELVAAVTDTHVQSTKEYCPHIHVFMAMKDESCIAFFEVPEAPDMTHDPNTPDWVQHLAVQVDDYDTIIEMKQRLESDGIRTWGPKDGHLCVSLYFFDPNGHRLELTNRKLDLTPEIAEDAQRILSAWSVDKTPRPEARTEHSI